MKKVILLKLVMVLAAFTLCLTGCAPVNDSSPSKFIPIEPGIPPEGFVAVKGGTVKGTKLPKDETIKGGAFDTDETFNIESFYICKHEVTRAEYKAVIEGSEVTVKANNKDKVVKLNPEPSIKEDSHDSCPDKDKDHSNYPVVFVSYYAALHYCNELSKKENLTPYYILSEIKVFDPSKEKTSISSAKVSINPDANGYRLPTNVEWEYAARGGNSSLPDWNYKYSGSDKIDDVAWYKNNNETGSTTNADQTAQRFCSHEVEKKSPNRLGIFDMSGNVREWCQDLYSEENANCRGGSWLKTNDWAQLDSYGYDYPNSEGTDRGFRVIRPCK